MAETNDPIAHIGSLNVEPNSITMLNGQRYHQRHRFESNQYFRIPANIWNRIRDDLNSTEYDVNGNSYNMLQLIKWYLKRHFYHQLPRILDLQRYYEGDNDIHYWRSNKIKRADNRIADNYPRFITDFDSGLFVGKPVKYGYSNATNENDKGEQLLDLIKEFNNFTDSRHHDIQMVKDLLNTGRAYELEYIVPGTHAPKVKRINPNQCFIIWSTDVDKKELCAVRYTFQRIENQYDYQIEIYTDKYVYTFDAGSDVEQGTWTLTDREPNLFHHVPITEFVLNDDRLGKWEPELDDIDALDVAMSEMANSEEDFSNATLVIEGAVKRPSEFVQLYDHDRPLFYQPGHAEDIKYITTDSFSTDPSTGQRVRNRPVKIRKTMDTKSNVMWLMPSTDNQGNVKSQPQMKYLTKQLDINEWQSYINELKARIEKFCGIPNLDSKQGGGGNQNELSIMTRLLNSIENSANFESNFRHGVIRRIKLLVDYWTTYNSDFTSSVDWNDPNDVNIQFDINLPVDLQGTTQELQSLAQTGKFSNQTIHEVAEQITHVDPNDEQNRMDSESADSQQSNMAIQQSYMASVANANGMGQSNTSNDANSDSDANGSPSDANNDNPSSSSDVPPSQANHALSSSSDSQSTQSSSAIQSSLSSDDSDSSVSGQFNNPNVDNNGSATSEIMDPNLGFGENGSTSSLNNSAADDMALAAVVLDSIYASGGYPSNFDSAMSSVVSQVASSSVSAAVVQSNSIDSQMMASMSVNDPNLMNSGSSSSDQS